MSTLALVGRKSGEELGRATLQDGKLSYSTALVEEIFEGVRASPVTRNWTDEQLFGYFTPTDPSEPGWSNGYLQVKQVD